MKCINCPLCACLCFLHFVKKRMKMKTHELFPLHPSEFVFLKECTAGSSPFTHEPRHMKTTNVMFSNRRPSSYIQPTRKQQRTQLLLFLQASFKNVSLLLLTHKEMWLIQSCLSALGLDKLLLQNTACCYYLISVCGPLGVSSRLID